jgi:hypothetical protein
LSPPRTCECDTCPKCRARTNAARNYRLKAYGRWTPYVVDATGTRRRIQALLALGWTLTDLGRRLGVTNRAIGHYSCGARREVLAGTARDVATLYDQLSMQPGPSAITRRRARQAGWHRPLCWDDDLIDDPTFQPVGCCSETPGRPPNVLPGDPADLARLAAAVNEHGARAAGWRYGASPSSVLKALTRAGWRNTAPPGKRGWYVPSASAQEAG